jgi:2-polyprenyl-3-methyl-5-hydroxy-6-metoxy-1,4-benzoquinol methylase
MAATTEVEAKVRDHFHDDAERFDAIYESKKGPFAKFIDNHWRGVVQVRLDENVKRFSPMEGKRLLDVGCGSGRFCLAYAAHGAKKVVGIDFAKGMIDIANKLAKDAGVDDRVEYICGLFPGDMGEVTEPFDGTSGNGFFDYIEEPVPIIAKMREMTKGRLIMSFPKAVEWRIPLRRVRFWMKGTPLFLYREAQLKQILADAGVTDYEIVDLGRDYLVDAKV